MWSWYLYWNMQKLSRVYSDLSCAPLLSRWLLLCISIVFSMSLPAHSGPWPLIQFYNHFLIDGRTPWTSDQLVTRPLPKHGTIQTQNKHIHTPNIHSLSGIRTHDPSVWADEDSSCLRPHSYCDQRVSSCLGVFRLCV
jgi:hypothetical protein